MSMNNFKQKFAYFRIQLSTFGRKLINDWSFSLAALIGYYLLISLLPLILCLFSMTYLIFGNDEYFLNKTRDRLTESFPQQNFAEIIVALADSISNSKQAIVVSIVSFLVAIFAGSRLFIGIDDVLVIIYRMRERKILQQNFHAIRMLLVFITIMPVIIIGSSVMALLKKNEMFYYFLTVFLGGIFAFILFILIYYFVPSRAMQWRKIWCGSLFAAIGLQILFLIFPIYVHQFMKDYIGQVGFLIIALLLFYLFGLVLVIGAQINAFFFDHIQPLPTALGNYINGYNDDESIRLIDGHHAVSALSAEFSPTD